MDKIWDKNPLKSEVIGRCGRDKKTNDQAEPTKALKKENLNQNSFYINMTPYGHTLHGHTLTQNILRSSKSDNSFHLAKVLMDEFGSLNHK